MKDNIKQKRVLSLHALGVRPSDCKAFDKVVVLAMKLGLTEIQAVSVARIAHAAKQGYHWSIPSLAIGLEINTKLGR